VSTFWELHNVFDKSNLHSANAENLYKSLIETFNIHNIPLSNVIGFGSDGCNVMMGENNSVASRFRESCPGNCINLLCTYLVYSTIVNDQY